MDTFRKFLAALCALLFILSGVLALFAFNVERQAFNSTAYKQAFEGQNLYERVPTIMADALHTTAAQNPNADPYLKALTLEDWQATVRLLLPPPELKALTDSALDSMFVYLNGESDSAVLSLTPLKSNLLGPAGVQVAGEILEAQPDCTAEQLLKMGLGFAGGDITLCHPPPEMLGLMTPLIESQVQVMAASIPDQVTLISGAPGNPASDPRARLNQTRTLMKITPVFPLLFLFTLTLLGVRSLMDWLKWWGGPFLVTGGVSALLALLGAPVFSRLAGNFLQSQGAGLIPPPLLSTVRETLGAVTGQILGPVLVQSLILAALGVAMVATALFLAYRARRIQ